MKRLVVTFAATTAAITLSLAAKTPTIAADLERTPSQVQTMSLVTAASQRAAASARLTPSAAAAARPNLAVGASNPAVIYVQQKLGVRPVSGYFGQITLAAVKAYQKKHRLTQTGTVGARTWASLLAAESTHSKSASRSKATAKADAAAKKAAATKKAAEAKEAAATKKAAAAKKAAAKAEAASAAARKAVTARKAAARKAAAAKKAAAQAAAKEAAARRAAEAKEAAAKEAAAKEAAAKEAAAKEAAAKEAAAKEAAAKEAAEKAARQAANAVTPEEAAAKRPVLQFDMGPGDPAVIYVQRYLKVDPQSGYFGAMTREAVLAFQRGLGIPASGIVGPRTWQAIFEGKTVAAPASGTDSEDPEAPTLSADQTQNSSVVTKPSNATIPTPTYSLPENPTAADKALVFALAQVGKPYVLGGNGPEVFDCSGLVQQAYLSAGVTLPRLASQQQFAGQEVTLESLRPGDLLYYQDGSSPRRGHISMFAGNGLAVEAANPRRGVRIRPLNESWYAERFVRAVHING